MKKLMAANWKMYKDRADALSTAQELRNLVSEKLPEDREVLVFPPFTSIDRVAEAFSGAQGFYVGGQDYYLHEEGAYTGEISPSMLKDAGAAWGLTGHSERRHVLGEDDELVGQKTAYGLQQGLSVCLCIGETIEQRKGGKVQDVIDRQLEAGVRDVDQSLDPARLAVAYEPVWAIGTGEVAGPEEIEEAHRLTRKKLLDLFGDKANEIRILYGGSVKPANVSGIISLDNVDGVLVGGASLASDSFAEIVLG